MPYQDEAQEIADRLATLEGAGLVHARVRTGHPWKVFILRFVDPADSKVRGWQVSRRKAWLNGHRWFETWSLLRVEGVVDDDESELAFQEHLNDAVRLFRDPGMSVFSFGDMAEGMKIVLVEERLFGDVLCHVAECEIEVSRYFANL